MTDVFHQMVLTLQAVLVWVSDQMKQLYEREVT